MYQMLKSFLLSISVLILSGCSNASFMVANAPQISYKGDIISNVSYGLEDRNKLDIYIPEAFEKPLPVIVFFHGGRWSFGSKDQYKFVGMTLSKLGYIVVLPNTRLYPEVKHPVFVEDGAKALAWVYSNIAEYGGNDNLYLSGHSSGAHIAALLTADETYLKQENLSTEIVNAFAGLSGPYDFIPEEEDLMDMFGPPSKYSNMQVPTFIEGTEPPMLLIHTKDDETVIIRNLNRLKSAIDAKGGIVETIIYPSGDHVDAVAALSWVNPGKLSVAEDMDKFFKTHQ